MCTRALTHTNYKHTHPVPLPPKAQLLNPYMHTSHTHTHTQTCTHTFTHTKTLTPTVTHVNYKSRLLRLSSGPLFLDSSLIGASPSKTPLIISHFCAHSLVHSTLLKDFWSSLFSCDLSRPLVCLGRNVTHTDTHKHTYTHSNIYTYIHICRHVYLYVCVGVCVYIDSVCIHVFVYEYMHICLYKCRKKCALHMFD